MGAECPASDKMESDEGLGGGPTGLALSEASKDVTVQRTFSNKPKATGKFGDFFEKIESYVAIISGPAIELHKANPLTFRVVEGGKSSTPFKIRDTLTSRAEIGDLAAKFKDDIIAVIGVGGTGAYVLDFLVKTPVREIRVALYLVCPTMMTLCSSTTIGCLKPNSLIDLATASMAASLIRGLFSYGRIDDRGRISIFMDFLCLGRMMTATTANTQVIGLGIGWELI
jgi:hypothetical protein